MQLAVEGCPTRWHAGAILTLASTPAVELADICHALEDRVRGLPRLRQRLWRPPPGCGRPVWVDDPDFEMGRHVAVVACPPPGDEPALLNLAARLLAQPLAPDRPLWSATFVTGLAEGRSALVVAFHHVLADGIGGLAVLAALVDGHPPAPASVPSPPPRPLQLAADATRSRLRALTRLPAGLGRVRAGMAELGGDRSVRAPHTSLNRPTGPHRRLAVARVQLDAVRAVARQHGGTVNDLVLTAVTGALRGLLQRRGESVDQLVASVMVSGRDAARPTELGNVVGVIPVALPTTGAAPARLGAIAATMRTRKQVAARGASAALVVPVFRALAAAGVLGWLLNRQRMINTVVTNLRGPDRRLSLFGVPVADVVALPTTAGNVTVGFAVLSYAGVLSVTITADPATCPDLDDLAERLQQQLDDLR